MNDTIDSGNLLMTAAEGDKFNVEFEDGERLEDALVTNVEQHDQYDRRVVFNNGESERHVLFVEGRGLEYRVFCLLEREDDDAGSDVDSVKPGVLDSVSEPESVPVTVTSLSEAGQDIEYAMENAGI